MLFTLEQQIIHQLLLRSSIEADIGLFYGKTGLILFFAHYFRLTGNPIFEDTADELMEELLGEIHSELPLDFASGLAGIGWGIEYLIQNGFLEGDSLKICEEVDKKIMERYPQRIVGYSLETGLEGLLHYVLSHIQGVHSQHAKLPFDETYLKDLFQAISTLPETGELSDNFKTLSGMYSRFYETGSGLDYTLKLSTVVEDIEIDTENLATFPLGLKKGLSGFLINELRIYEGSMHH